MQTKPLDALRLWWRDINYTNNQRKALGAIAVIAVGISAFFIFKPHQSVAVEVAKPAIVAPPMFLIDVSGEVKTPGVYELAPNSRVIDAIKAAGGVTKNADLSVINQARMIKDGEQIYIEKKIYGGGAKSVRKANGPLNINRATIKEFDALPGVGPVIAARIVEYRKVNGPFSTVDDLKKVPGIGGSKFEKFKEKIRV